MTAGSPVPNPDGGATVEQESPFPPHGQSTSGLKPNGRVRTPATGVQAVRDEMVAEVARALGFAGVSPFEIEDFRIEDVADRLRRAGYRRVSEDDDTIDRVAEALHARNCDCTAWSDEDLASARAAVRALREETLVMALEVHIVQTETGSHIEPPLDPAWSDLVKLQWKAAVVSIATGASVYIEEDDGELVLTGLMFSYGAGDFDHLWAVLNGIQIGFGESAALRGDQP